MRQRICFVLTTLICSGHLYADQYHYNNILIGDRAIGMGGAYTGVADDASGVFYNPAGLAFALSNDVSGSANAMYSRTVTYKKTVGKSDFVERSGGTLPSFFGGLQKLDHVFKGLVFAFGMYTTDSEQKDQDDLISGVDLGKPSPCTLKDAKGKITATGKTRPDEILDRFHRTVNQRGQTFYAGGAIGWRFHENWSVGLGSNYVTVDELVQEYQDVRTQLTECHEADTNFTSLVEQKTQNIRQHVVGYAVQPVLGVQGSILGKLSIGLTLKAGSFLSQKFQQGLEQRAVSLVPDDQATVDKDVTASTESSALVTQYANKSESSNPLGKLPFETRLGVAYFYSTRLLMTFDVMNYSAVKKVDNISGVGSIYQKKAVTNLAAGAEYYIVPAFPVRVGIFTNNDARPKVATGKSGQADHVDYKGGTVFLSWVQPNSQIGGGIVLQKGAGKAQKVGGNSTAIQDVVGDAFTFAFSASHSF